MNIHWGSVAVGAIAILILEMLGVLHGVTSRLGIQS